MKTRLLLHRKPSGISYSIEERRFLLWKTVDTFHGIDLNSVLKKFNEYTENGGDLILAERRRKK